MRLLSTVLAISLATAPALAAEPSDAYSLTRIEWLAVKINLYFLSMTRTKKTKPTCFDNKKAIVCIPMFGDDKKDEDANRSILKMAFDREVKALGLEGKVTLEL